MFVWAFFFQQNTADKMFNLKCSIRVTAHFLTNKLVWITQYKALGYNYDNVIEASLKCGRSLMNFKYTCSVRKRAWVNQTLLSLLLLSKTCQYFWRWRAYSS